MGWVSSWQHKQGRAYKRRKQVSILLARKDAVYSGLNLTTTQDGLSHAASQPR